MQDQAVLRPTHRPAPPFCKLGTVYHRTAELSRRPLGGAGGGCGSGLRTDPARREIADFVRGDVDITMWITLLIMCKTRARRRFAGVSLLLWRGEGCALFLKLSRFLSKEAGSGVEHVPVQPVKRLLQQALGQGQIQADMGGALEVPAILPDDAHLHPGPEELVKGPAPALQPDRKSVV